MSADPFGRFFALRAESPEKLAFATRLHVRTIRNIARSNPPSAAARVALERVGIPAESWPPPRGNSLRGGGVGGRVNVSVQIREDDFAKLVVEAGRRGKRLDVMLREALLAEIEQ